MPVEVMAPEHQFHGGLFGQYGSALSPISNPMINAKDTEIDETVAPDAPDVPEPKENSADDREAADAKPTSKEVGTGTDEASSSDKSSGGAESVPAKKED